MLILLSELLKMLWKV